MGGLSFAGLFPQPSGEVFYFNSGGRGMPNSNARSLFRRLIALALSGFCLVILPGFCSLSGLPVGFHVRVASQLALHSISSGK